MTTVTTTTNNKIVFAFRAFDSHAYGVMGTMVGQQLNSNGQSTETSKGRFFVFLATTLSVETRAALLFLTCLSSRQTSHYPRFYVVAYILH